MTKWNPTAICEMMNKRFNSKMNDNKDGFEVEGNMIIIQDIDRGPRTDHGGSDGDGWMRQTEINKCMKPFLSKYMGRIKIMERDLRDDKYDGNITMDYGEKGHISIEIRENKTEKNPVIKRNPPKGTKKSDPKTETNPVLKRNAPKTTKGINQTDFIRMKINGLENRENLITELAKQFDKKESWAKSRLATYEKAYGNYGANDKKLRK